MIMEKVKQRIWFGTESASSSCSARAIERAGVQCLPGQARMAQRTAFPFVGEAAQQPAYVIDDPQHLVLSADATVADLVRAAVAAYVREGRRPPIHQHPGGAADGGDAADGFELHFSKYSLESLRPEEKVLDLGSRNFFLCARRSAASA
ncbi:uncharacterized protein LOC101755143 [Setaria italica]|uniref:uncharacterized protein LOC101755143 n=1 Tax=Setaria italica TaxID=4555 RepID=UPI000BE53363|nr:uncharacterized protein LOC101755143 [Setaria italica]